MAEYIERKAAIAVACKGCNKEFPNEPCEPAECHIQQGLFSIPAADVVEVVRCKDCDYCEQEFDDYWCNYNWNYAPPGKPKLTRADGFCHNGERREGE